jgi:phosphoribosylformylglycinamidine synthase
VILGKVSGRPPRVDLDREGALVGLLVEVTSQGLVASAHDCSDGGLAICLAESALAGGCGFRVGLTGDLPPHLALFSESVSRAVVSVEPGRAPALEALAARREIPFSRLGETGGARMAVEGVLDLALAEAGDVYESAIPNLMEIRRAAG